MKTYKNTDGRLVVTEEVAVVKSLEELKRQKKFINAQMDVLQARLDVVNIEIDKCRELNIT